MAKAYKRIAETIFTALSNYRGHGYQRTGRCFHLRTASAPQVLKLGDITIYRIQTSFRPVIATRMLKGLATSVSDAKQSLPRLPKPDYSSAL
jgi:hypothetical protein